MNAQAQQRQQPEPPKLETSATTCIVGCKLPHGLVCQLFSEDNKSVVESFTIKGANDSRIVGGYGLTQGVPTAFMMEWLKRNAKHPAVANGNIFIHTNVKSAEARAKDMREQRSGLEAINPIADAKKHGLAVDPVAEAAYKKQVQENPLRDRQIVE
jgi:hypothetical protein